MISENKIATD